jgi:hypothetical protein
MSDEHSWWGLNGGLGHGSASYESGSWRQNNARTIRMLFAGKTLEDSSDAGVGRGNFTGKQR